MRQTSFVDGGFQKFHKRTRKEPFLAEMETIIPWKEFTDEVLRVHNNPESKAFVLGDGTFLRYGPTRSLIN